MTIGLHAASIADTHAIAAAIADLSRVGDIIVLAGEMGAGKTAFAQGFGRSLGVTDHITSPTYTLVHSYPVESGPRSGKVTLHHADLYRLERTAEVSDLALRELAEFGGIVLVEWGDVVDVFGDHLIVHLDMQRPDDLDTDPALSLSDDDSDVLALDGARHIELDAVGPGWASRWDRLSTNVEAYRC
ncbi:MAG: tRNA (adenosine(37)-N6)-threonylcarbamoyltransferase complex ATPase subunit type 1 TsaE [Ilumatobacter sp.]